MGKYGNLEILLISFVNEGPGNVELFDLKRITRVRRFGVDVTG
jgi:hypothetical protein